MAYIITEPCIGTKDTACVDVCPVDCIHPRKDEAEFEAAQQLVDHPGQDNCQGERPGLVRFVHSVGLRHRSGLEREVPR